MTARRVSHTVGLLAKASCLFAQSYNALRRTRATLAAERSGAARLLPAILMGRQRL